VGDALHDAGLAAVRIAGWTEPAWAASQPSAPTAASAMRTCLVSPLDPLLWTRPRVRRLFGRELTLEAYKPVKQRTRGYFSMPVLDSDELVAEVDPKVRGGVLEIRSCHVWDVSRLDAVASAIARAATWRRCQRVAVLRCQPPRLRSAIEKRSNGRLAELCALPTEVVDAGIQCG
jgi:uncharacterized protein YcaQ